MGRFYNAPQKEEFLNEYTGDTRIIYGYVFERAAEIEDYYKQDICNMNKDRIEEVIMNQEGSTLSAVLGYGSVISSYISWAMENGRSKMGQNVLDGLGRDWYKDKGFIKRGKRLYSEAEIIVMENKLVNYQDKITIRLLFEGVFGHELSELVSLTKHDIDWDERILTLRDDERPEPRYIKVGTRCMEFLDASISEKEYKKKNGESPSKNPVVALINTDYIIRSTIMGRGKENIGRSDRFTVFRRLANIKEYFELTSFTAKNIHRSGMLKVANNILDGENRELTNEELTEITERFGYKKLNINGYETYNYTLLREFINLENIRELYPNKNI